MLYINQEDYLHVHYNQQRATGKADEASCNVAKAGCGLCCVCMLIDHLTEESLSVEDCVDLAEKSDANLYIGTNMRVFAPVVAEKFGLKYSTTNDTEQLVRHLQSGGEAIVHVANKPSGERGIFTSGGHYMLLLSTDGETLRFFDPHYDEKRYHEWGTDQLVKREGNFLYCSIPLMDRETQNREVHYYLFSKEYKK